MNIQKLWLKIFNKKKYREFKNQRTKIKNKNLYDKNIKKKLDEISFIYLDDNDVLRHKLVKTIIKAYKN